ncbi:uncharacterized protein LOC112053033 [Bicyclus anynana]|uniref:Uncharacterized protein LOC112053033 n=1 Tax=Bicyclus anynana TaxID=110368 RepID=A0A6J1NJX6_BICAN|nr:uncharacterized protein LOC112053033 [Bicyclus anynana]XP_052740728.1 uncharacterized protein LOC112053033 [Bicyclus anynana]XP_052740729.1 uncharacterized protein LOC112053033 [Bicyclus anynana]XP_052740730.1 uncharacterized protein LOC112053033 [Bicyclus anynana]
MAKNANKSHSLFDEDFFDDSSLLANFDNSDFKERLDPNDNADKSLLNVSALCCDEEISGYDKITGQTWAYPTNYPIRDYQFNIINAAILKNTLVSLPTGLGKTFIAAVIMYNYYRWYPLGKIVFTAPTRPLVAQQIEACYKIVALPHKDTIEMTGHMPVNTRKSHWQTKRVFFATPQVVYNDIKSGICPGEKIRCLVVDEAHRAKGNYAYCQIISTLTDMGHTVYRVLALSATPGSKLEDVINVVKNLHIAHLELRSEGCIDVASYSHSRKINTVVISLGEELTLLRKQYVEIMDRYARRLQQFNILPQNLGNLSKGRVLMLYKEYQTKDRTARHPQHNYIMKDFTLIISLYHGLELLMKHGSRVFLNFFDEHPEKSWIQTDDNLTSLLERLRDDLGIDPLSLDRSVLPDGTIPEMPKELSYGHPKFYKLKEIILDHFNNAKKNEQDTRAIVFCEYRESVNLVHCLLLQLRPLIVPQMFVGQGASGKNGKAVVSQKQQLRVMRSFRSGECNTLVCTCVAEEGLDVGSVDLIICFDISTRSPVRLVQRCGRTGRERGGQVHILVTEGREHQTLLDCMRQRDGLNKKILQSKEVENNLYKLNPRMVPRDFMPKCQKMYITVPNSDNKEEGKADNVKSKKGQKNLKNMLLDRASTSKVPTETIRAQTKERQTIVELDEIPAEQKHTRGGDLPTTTQNSTPDSQDVFKRRTTTSPLKTKLTKRKQKVTLSKSPGKNGDIRALFSTATKSTKSYTKLMSDLDIDSNLPTRIISILVDLTVEEANSAKQCYFCQNACNCLMLQKYKSEKSLSLDLMADKLYLPDINLIDNLNADMLLNYMKSNTDSSLDSLCDENKPKPQCNAETADNFDLQFDFDSISNSPKEDKVTPKTDVGDIGVGKNFDIGDLDDIFADSSSPEVKKDDQNMSDPNKTLEYFGLDNFEDIFAESDDEASEKKVKNKTSFNDNSSGKKKMPDSLIEKSVEIVETNPNSLVNLRPLSPSILSGRTKRIDRSFTSPILCSQSNTFKNTTISNIQSSTPFSNVKRKFNLGTRKVAKTPEVSHTTLHNDSKETTNKSMFTITQLVNMINQPENKTPVLNNNNNYNEIVSETSKTSNNVSDRSSSPILLTQANKVKSVNKSIICKDTTETKTPEKLEMSPILLTQQDRKKKESSRVPEQNKSNSILNTTPSIVIPDSDSDFDDIVEIDDDILIKDGNKTNRTPNKRKHCDEVDDVITASPYFSKKQKLDGNRSQAMTLQEKVLAALTSNKFDSINNDYQTNVLLHSPTFKVQKENKDPCPFNSPDKESDGEKLRNNLAKLQLFRRESKLSPRKSVIHDSTNTSHRSAQKEIYDDSDDDFVDKKSTRKHKSDHNNTEKHKVKYKKKKKIKKAQEFLDLEAELSDDGSASGDELSDESVGSIIDFICDKNTSFDDDDMHALYLRSVKSPVKNGVFKIPQLPNMYDKQEVLSQYVEEDAYEMDSFCVDSHIGLTQHNELSELELAEKRLKEEKKRRKTSKTVPNDDADSPIVRRKRKNAKRQIRSDSEDST